MNESLFSRGHNLERLRGETFDVLIIGGGINGAGLARDLALRAKVAGRALNVALVERKHFSSGTSGKNSHLIHGGLRYLKQFDFHLVREALEERATLLRIAPHLVEPLPFLLPLEGFLREAYYNLGLTLYDRFGGGFPRHRRLGLDQVRKMEPGLGLPRMTAAAEYYDAQVRSARLVLENIFEAQSNGAVCANYVAAGRRTRDSVELHDRIAKETFEARAKVIVDATGPWARDPSPRLVRGSHIVLPRLNASDHAIAYFDENGRILFFIPWGERNDRTLIGTTDVDHPGSPDDVKISNDEVSYLRSMAERVFPASASIEPVAAFSSLRPLLVTGGSATRATREYRIFFDSEGVLRITGGKFTTYRAMCEEAADLAVAELRGVHVTAETPLNGNSAEAMENLRAEARALAGKYALETGDICFLIQQYGLRVPAVLECVPERGEFGLARLDAGRLRYAMKYEMARYPADFLEVSTTLGLEGPSKIDFPAID
ncbi:MAG TPA: glycerol-3-phosphate dehydrogenase/oxidase [Bryobacteraceae bacterium]|nr:glycerol-3-phosphate dehydrogenase/oxidase [Bryobacteraceae bacterium]